MFTDTPIVSVKILDERGEGPSSAILDGCMWLLRTTLDGVTPNDDNMTNAEALGVDVINMSFGYPDDPFGGTSAQVCNVMRMLRETLGVVSVAAAGECHYCARVGRRMHTGPLTVVSSNSQSDLRDSLKATH